MRFADPRRLARRLERLQATHEAKSALDELLLARIPIHFGGMSDPFMPAEVEHRVSRQLLQILAEHSYPTIISTKGTLLERDEYIALLSAPNFAVQFSLTTRSDELSTRIDAGAPPTSVRLTALKTLAKGGVKVAVRHQPVLPTMTGEVAELMTIAAELGARHYALEHLKLPVERYWQHRNSLSAAVGFDLERYYASRHSSRVGREWVLPIEERLEEVVRLKAVARRCGLSFGAADNDLLHLSDGSVCCSGADLLGMGGGLKFNFLTAVRSGLSGDPITFASIARNWRPKRSIAEFVNSRSRQTSQTFDLFLRSRWNGVPNGPSPEAFYGVIDSGEQDQEGMKIYKIRDAVRRLTAS
jgi:DNA repair photolyase